MAGIETRKGPRGTTFRVYWREGGGRDGARDSETCDTKATAKRFKALVEAAGERRPDGYPKGCRGMGIGTRGTRAGNGQAADPAGAPTCACWSSASSSCRPRR
ncbi:hypothetical protein Ssi02_57990 [Sinosporangium siamense]|uniref:Uncharacterized protein n=1 Tax=Sinosporangium siamense TaxID=1367973 RepID=A0A919V9L8_9ACTN|nr:hypothetical protein Ssi02_57990 [Sinosporangium siamense]